MVSVPSWALALVVSLMGLIFAGMGFFYARMQSAEKKAREDGIVVTKLEALEKKMDAFASTMITQQSLCSVRGERLALVEASAKSAHLRIDEIIAKAKWG